MERSVEELAALFGRVGLDETKALETTRNKKLSTNLCNVICEAGIGDSGVERPVGLMLYALAVSAPKDHLQYLIKRILAKDLRSEDQLQAALKYLKGGGFDESDPVAVAAFDEASGIGVSVDEEKLGKAVAEAIQVHRQGLETERYGYSFNGVLKTVRERPDMRWADRKRMKELVDAAILEILGPKGPQDESAIAAKKPSHTPTTTTATVMERSPRVFEGDVLKLHRPGENPQANPEILRRHLEATGGKVVTRFPPEPNGFLHIGHAKAINFSFGYAEAHGGICYLRFDDTNPEAEETRYYDAIRENVAWLGFKPFRETAASDNFAKLHAYAVKLIKRGKAYVCHQTPEEIALGRGGEDGRGPKIPSPWRDRPIEENLREFERMRLGEYEEGKAVLRLKQDLSSPNPCMWDLVAYRILYTPHCRTGRQWNIYPMYDFTHCLCDSIENITHSLCTTEFILAREAYYWVIDQLEVYKPVQWEYGRLRITNTVLSKRRLMQLVEKGHVRGWDDPRLYTLAALRRRGFPPSAINRFVQDLGITTAVSVVDVRKLEAYVRDDLNRATPRRMAVLDPVPVELTNLDQMITISLPNDPRDPFKGESTLQVTSNIFIDSCDFRPNTDPNYFRLAPGQPVGLFRLGVLTCQSFEQDPETGKVTLIRGTIDLTEAAVKVKTFIQWVPAADCINAEVRMYGPLFKSANPDAVPGGFLADLAPNSLTVIPHALVDGRVRRVDGLKVEQTFQFQRVGYFCVDPDTEESGKPVFNLTVSIKEDPNKN